ncbi:unnamed protein product, partial [Didymodactylos carnosus]
PLVSIYIGHTEPNINLWLGSSFAMLKCLKEKAFHVESVHSVLTTSFNLVYYGVIGDCPALKMILNMIEHTGYYCCFYCKLKDHHDRRYRKRQYPYVEPVILRDEKSVFSDSRTAEAKGKNTFGHLGRSILQDILDVPLPKAVLCDYTHVTLLRHFKDVVKTVSFSLSPAVRKRIDYELRQQAFPHFFNRKLRGIEDFSHIKASELKNLLLYGFLPHFFTFLRVEQAAFIGLFICGIRCLHSERPFGDQTSAIADQLLKAYYQQHASYFQ